MGNPIHIHAGQSGNNRKRQQQPRALKTRHKILAASAATFDVDGYASATINAIAIESNLSKGALYFHFTSKEAIAQRLIEDWGTAISQMFFFSDPTAGLHIAKLRSAFTDLARRLENDQSIRAGMKLTLDPSIENSRAAYQNWVGAVRSLVDQGIRAGEMTDTFSGHHIAWNLCAGFIGAVHNIGVVHDAVDFHSCISEMLTAYLPDASL